MTSTALLALDGVASALREAASQATSVVGGALGGLNAMAGPALRDAGGLAGDMLADCRARKKGHYAREVPSMWSLFFQLQLEVIMS